MQSSLILGWQKSMEKMKTPTYPHLLWEHMVIWLQSIVLQVIIHLIHIINVRSGSR